MNCKHCNSTIDPQARYCSYCGCEIAPNSASKPQPKGNFWIKLFISCILITAVFTYLLAAVNIEPTETIKEQIGKLQGQHYTEAYYNYTAKSFQDAVSLEKFRTFFAKYPVFLTSETIKVINENTESNASTVEAVITNTKDEHLNVQYRLIKEGDKWKILSMKFEDDPLSSRDTKSLSREIAEADQPTAKMKTEAFDPKPLYKTIQNQITDIKQGDVQASYEKYTSKEFQKATTYDIYNKFIKGHPGFVDNEAINFDKIEVENNIVTITGTLISKGERHFPFEYNLTYEDGAWKILHIEVHTEKGKSIASENKNDKPVTSKMVFDKFSIGTRVNTEGLITNPETAFQSDAGPIHLNLFLKNAIAGTEIEVEFQHVDSGSKAPKVSAKVPEDGDMVLSFVFTPPSKGWPSGTYHIEAKSSDAVEGFVDFKVE